jgi:hypothetical protein
MIVECNKNHCKFSRDGRCTAKKVKVVSYTGYAGEPGFDCFTFEFSSLEDKITQKWTRRVI